MSLRAAGLVIYRQVSEKIEYLLMQTSYGTHHWTPPKGHVDPGESDMQTALRETEEEAGLTPSHLKVTDFRWEMNYFVNGKPKTVMYWLAKLVDENAQVRMSDEHQDFRWLPLEEASDLAQYKQMQDLLHNCQRFIQANKI